MCACCLRRNRESRKNRRAERRSGSRKLLAKKMRRQQAAAPRGARREETATAVVAVTRGLVGLVAVWIIGGGRRQFHPPNPLCGRRGDRTYQVGKIVCTQLHRAHSALYRTMCNTLYSNPNPNVHSFILGHITLTPRCSTNCNLPQRAHPHSSDCTYAGAMKHMSSSVRCDKNTTLLLLKHERVLKEGGSEGDLHTSVY